LYYRLNACTLPGCGTWNVPTTKKGSGRAPRGARTAAWKALCTAATFRVGAVACSCCGPFGTTIGPLGFARLTRESPAVQSPQAPNRLAVPTSGLPWRSRSADLDRLADSSPRARSAGYGAYLRSRRNTGRTLDSSCYLIETPGMIDDFSQRLFRFASEPESHCLGFARSPWPSTFDVSDERLTVASEPEAAAVQP